MSTTQLAIIAPAIVAIVVTVSTLVAQGRTARAHRDHERRLAWEQRQQERLAAVYVETLAWVNMARRWAGHRMLAVSANFERPETAPELPSVRDLDLLAAKVSAFGSQAVGEALSQFSDAFVAFAANAGFVESESDAIERQSAWDAMRATNARCQELAEELRVTVQRELAGPHASG